MATRIPIHVSNHTAFVWDVDHAATLRSEHRICGVLTGTLPHLSQQNVFLGLPLVLMPEELVLLVEKQLAMIVHDPAAHHTPTPSQLETWDAERRQDVALQLARLEQRKAEDRASAAARSGSSDDGHDGHTCPSGRHSGGYDTAEACRARSAAASARSSSRNI
ncbi:hypothetical protein BJV77DRAFT_656332 [Russula vinacea]|nr:hypothetical protein BJV77DRAFT_656332 [Russula vinacea]